MDADDAALGMWQGLAMAEQFSLFAGDVLGAKVESGTDGDSTSAARRRTRAFDPSALPTPAKIGPPTRLFGTSSWTYPGWHGRVYRDVAAYGAPARFTELCLAEYARDPRFRCAGADNMYYMPPSSRTALLKRYQQQLASLPEPIELCPKVWHGITVHRYSPQQQRDWRLDSELNPGFLDADHFLERVALPLQEGLGLLLGPLIVELQESELHAADFVRLLDDFLGRVRPRFGGRLAIELRTQSHFTPRYLDVLSAHGASHVLNAWTRMPGIGWQFDQLRARHGLDWSFFVIRALLRSGVRYDEASVYEPYDRLVLRAPEVRADILRVLRAASEAQPCYVLVNNHLEGHSPATIAELQSELYATPVAAEPPSV